MKTNLYKFPHITNKAACRSRNSAKFAFRSLPKGEKLHPLRWQMENGQHIALEHRNHRRNSMQDGQSFTTSFSTGLEVETTSSCEGERERRRHPRDEQRKHVRARYVGQSAKMTVGQALGSKGASQFETPSNVLGKAESMFPSKRSIPEVLLRAYPDALQTIRDSTWRQPPPSLESTPSSPTLSHLSGLQHSRKQPETVRLRELLCQKRMPELSSQLKASGA